MRRVHALVVVVLLALATAAGAFAVLTTSSLGEKATKPQVVQAAAIAKQSKQLDAWSASLDKALRTRTPALPPLPHYARVVQIGIPRAADLPTVSLVRRVPTTPTPKTTLRAAPRRPVLVAKPAHRAAAGHSGLPATVTPPVTTTAATAVDPTLSAPASPPPAPPAPAPAVTVPAPAPQPAPTQEQGAEQQCEALKQAAEGKGEAARRAAEQQCEQLKESQHSGNSGSGQAGSGDDGGEHRG